MEAANAVRAALQPTAVLRYDRLGTGTFTRGYMVGVLICKCGAKKLVSCSGGATPGFLAAVGQTEFTYVGGARSAAQAAEDADAPTWECAARHLFENLDGHEPKTMTERWFSPHIAGVIRWHETPRVAIEFTVKGIDKVNRQVTQNFRYGQSVPSCGKCQARLPKKVCGNECP